MKAPAEEAGALGMEGCVLGVGQRLKETIVTRLGQFQIAVADAIASCFVPAAFASDQGADREGRRGAGGPLFIAKN